MDEFLQRSLGDIADELARLRSENAVLLTAQKLREREISDLKSEISALKRLGTDASRFAERMNMVATELVQRRHELYTLVCSQLPGSVKAHSSILLTADTIS